MILSDIFNDLIYFIINLINLFIKPIDNLILQLIPDLSNAFTAIGNFFQYISSGLSWALSLTGFSPNTWALIATYFTFKLTAPMTFYVIKLSIAWYNKLKP